jgi:RNA polymerase sigma factor (sigma-70 family)
LRPSAQDRKALSFEEGVELSEAWQKRSDRKARDRLLASVYDWAVRESGRYSRPETPYEDLLQEGLIGAMRACDLYDSSKGTTFFSYAAQWIRAAMFSYLGRTRTLLSATSLRNGKGKKSTLEKRMGVSVQYGLEDEEGHDLGLLRGVRHDDEMLDEKRRMEEMHFLVHESGLTEEELSAIQLRYFSQDGELRTLREVGEALGKSGEWVRLLEMSALAKLRKAAEGLFDS